MTTSIQSNPVSASLLAAVNGTASTSSAANTASASQDRFMTLLVTQLKNQDPLNPLDNAQMTSQLAQLSTVSGIEKLNTTLETLAESFRSSQSIGAASMIGKSVLASGSGIALTGESAAFGVDFAGGAEKVKASIVDASGRTVRSLDLGAQQAGTSTFQWDGKTDSGSGAASGSYSVRIEATSAGQAVSATPLSFGLVDSVTQNSSGVKLNVHGVGQIELADVRQIL